MTGVEQAEVQVNAEPVADDPPARTLAAARQAQNLSLTDVANRLKLSVQQVEALEQGAYDRLPGPVFVRGFTRNYARLLKLDAEAMVRAVDAQLPRQAPDRHATESEANIPMPAKNASRWRVLAGTAAVVFLGAAVVDLLWPETAPSPASSPVTAPSVVQPAAPPAPVAAPALPAVAQAPVVPAPVAQEPAAAPAAAAVPAGYQPASEAGRALRFDFDQASWVQVRDGTGKVVLQGLFQPGASREITGEAPLAVVVGNAPGVRLTYAGKAVDLVPHTRVAVARVTLE